MMAGDGALSPACAGRVRAVTAALLLAALVVVVFQPVTGFSFLEFDDTTYVTKNGMVRAGLSQRGTAWALTTFEASNWHPLTWLSHMLDVRVYGVHPAGHHRTSLLLHAGAALLLFAALRGYTGSTWRSLAAAGLFGVHPLRVESVAWVSERKDVLSALLWMAALAAYLRWLRRPATGRYVLLCALFALGLAAKPMAVTLPLALLLLDWWPLGRFSCRPGVASPLRQAIPLLVEKIPLFLLSAGSAALTLLAQRRGGALGSLVAYPLGTRAANALHSYTGYVADFFHPAGLSFHYPYAAAGLSPGKVASAVLLLSVASLAAALLARRRPALLAGWLWYLGTLVPVIGLVQVGGQASADRYTYVPSVGLAVALLWGLVQPGRSRPRWWLPALAVAAAGIVLALSVATRRQLHVWRDTDTLARHALAQDGSSWMAHYVLGSDLFSRGRRPEAAVHLETATRLNPAYAPIWSNLGIAYAALSRFPEAEDALRTAVSLDPGDATARFNLGFRLLRRGDRGGALAQYEALQRLDAEAAASLRRFLDAAARP